MSLEPTDDLAPPEYRDRVVDAYRKDVDLTLLRENLRLTVDERFRKFESVARFAQELARAGRARPESSS
ncbi:MAG TPA: hypothetical protein EYQ83_06035 [Acidobacteria bacterium]|nr:hypothetical protein [Acidobacteriota bacterium]